MRVADRFWICFGLFISPPDEHVTMFVRCCWCYTHIFSSSSHQCLRCIRGKYHIVVLSSQSFRTGSQVHNDLRVPGCVARALFGQIRMRPAASGRFSLALCRFQTSTTWQLEVYGRAILCVLVAQISRSCPNVDPTCCTRFWRQLWPLRCGLEVCFWRWS